MILKPAPNSLFAILLRNPWWISFAIAAAFALLSRALLPDAYWLAGALGGTPFVVIGGIAFVRQMRAPRPAAIEARFAALQAMNWREFEADLSALLTAQGWQATRVQDTLGKVAKGVAEGADLAFTRGPQTRLIAARRFKAAHHGEDGIHALAQAVEAARENVSRCTGLYLTVGNLSPTALATARRLGIEVRQGQALAQWWLSRHDEYQK